MKLMLVEDDLVIASELAKILTSWQYDVTMIEDFEHVIETFNDIEPHLVILDVNLPYFNGYYWCSEIRKVSNVPIIFISSVTDRMDMIMAMQMGADDYITKPIDTQFLVSKIQALLRRTYDFTVQTDIFTFHDLRLDVSKSQLDYKGQTMDLTYTELQIMTILFQQQGNFVEREAILDYCWQNNQFIDDNTLAVNITRIRKKLRQLGLDKLIETKKNVGYRLHESEDIK
ncbi:response regulator transcription factor [Fundicoccus culcitae]|uniref:Response regulator transcription factor n=1 Tax=Fundicoccus culcitae TaxID=2969821 RepID=A0ABY5P5S8_9LACT|nr:response regulator transcription factor [Fundicoccus culcitae]UUX33783.1 response regulator transcription factor [Fundicoccus culcitae]